jgi:small subunit ribosomal protein S6
MNFYETLIILDPNLDDKSTENAIERIKELVIRGGGEVLKSENWGRRKLAYELKKRKDGIYVLLVFKSPPDAIVELERFYRFFDPVIKFLIIKLNKKQINSALSSPSETGDSERVESGAEGSMANV